MARPRDDQLGDRPVAQLCHVPLVLAAAGALGGRRTALTRRWPRT